jgi:xylulokinase
METLLGIDAGTSRTKAVLVRRDGRVEAQASLDHAIDLPAPGRAETDPEVWWREVTQLCRTLAAHAPTAWRRLQAVGASGVAATVVPVDGDGHPTHPAILYGIDTRAGREIAWLDARLGARRIVARGGRPLTAHAAGPKILWLRRHRPDVLAATRWFLGASGFLAHRLAGVATIDHYGAVPFAPLFDLARRAWNPDAAALIAPAAKLPALVPSHAVVGGVTAEASAATGLPAGLPVIAGTVDAIAEALSVGVVEPGDAMLMYGSTLFIIAVVRRSRPDPIVWPSLHCVPGRVTVSAGTATFGMAERWILEQLGPADRETLTAEARACPPGSEGLVVLPYLAGERTPLHDPRASGVVAGLTLRHGRGHLYRAFLEGTAYSARHNLDALEARHGRLRRLVAVGGGVEHPLWREIVGDVLGREQILCRERIGAAYGIAYLAGLGAGLFRDTTLLTRQWVVEVDRIRPDRRRSRLYEPTYRVYRRLYPRLRADMHALARVTRR